MPIFLGVHDFGGPITEDEMKHNWQSYQASCQKHGASAWKVFFNLEAGRAFCLTEAKSANDVKAAHNDISKPTKEIIEVRKFSG